MNRHSRWYLLWMGLPLIALGAIDRDTCADAPVTRKGVWRVQGNADGQRYNVTDCRNPMDEVKRAAADLERAGCKPGAPEKIGGRYSYELACVIKGVDGKLTMLKGSLRVDLREDDRFIFEAKANVGDQTHYEMVQATRLGDCKSAKSARAQ